MLSLDHTLPAIARRRRAAGFPPPQPVIFPSHAYGYWEGQGQSNMTGFNQVSDVPIALRVVNPGIEMMTNDPGWRPYILLDDGESETFDGQTYTGKIDEIEIPPAAGGAGPLIGLHEAMINGDLDQDGSLIPAGLLMGKFTDAGKLLHVFLPDHDDGTPPLGGANFNARNNVLPGSLRARLATDTIFAQGKIWMHGEANAAAARVAANTGVPEITEYAAGFESLRTFDREQLGVAVLPYYVCAIAEADVYDEAINSALRSTCRWSVAADGSVTDLGVGRDMTSYLIDHAIDLGGSMHFDMTQMRSIGALVWDAHQHLTGSAFGLTEDYPITAITPVHQTPPVAIAISDTEIQVTNVLNEDGVVYGLIQPTGGPAQDAAAIMNGGQENVAGLRGRSAVLGFSGLNAETDYDVWIAFETSSGDRAAVKMASAQTEAAPATAWSPADAGALIWLDAQDAATVTEDAGELTIWTDKGVNAVAVSPTSASNRPVFDAAGLNGLPALSFDCDDDLEGAGMALAADMCLLVVAEIGQVVNGSESLIDFEAQNLKVRAGNSAEFRARFELQNGSAVNLTPSPVTDYSGAPHLFLARYDAAAQQIDVWIDGGMVASGNGYATPIGAADNMRLMRHFGSALRLEGMLGEVVAISSALSEDRERLEGYAAHLWGLTGQLPAGHPYKSVAP